MPGDSSDGGTDNPAFIHDEETSGAGRGSESAACQSSGDEKAVANGNGNSSLASKNYVEPQLKSETRIEVPGDSSPASPQEKPKQNGHHGNGNNNELSFLNTTVTSVSNSDVSDKKGQIEAVNLELVSMKPYSGSNSHQAKNREACELPADPYEEYFVPVNEHRKFMRGEKLYVTKDKRSTKSHWRKILCWGCGFLIVALVVIVAILAATGVILTQEDNQPLLDAGRTTSRQFNDAQPAGSQEYVKNPPSSPSPATSTFPPWPTTDESLYRHVPKALDAVIKLDDLDWNDDMNNPKSRVYREVVDDLEKSLVKMLSLNDVMPIVKVHSISKDGEVKFRVSQPVFEKPEDNQNHLEDKFRQTGSAIGRYHVNRLQISSLIDHCYSGDMGCTDSCVYDYLETIFICMCPTGKSFDYYKKMCVDNRDLTYAHFGETGLDDVQGRSRTPDEVYHPESHDWKESKYDLHEHYYHHPEHTSPEPISEPGPSVDPSNESIDEPKSEPEPSSELPPDVKLKAASGPAMDSQPLSEPQPAAEPKAEPEPSAEPKAEPEPSAEPKAEPEPSAEPKAEPEPSAEPKAEPEPSAEPKAQPEPSAEPKAEPEPIAEPKAEPEPIAEPKAEPEPSAEPKAEPEPSAEPKSDPVPSAEPKSEPGPNSEPTNGPEPTGELQPAVESEAKPAPKSEPALTTADTKSEPHPSGELPPEAEPKAEPEPTMVRDPSSETHPIVEPKSEIELTAEPKSEPEPSSEPEPEVKLKPELDPAVEPEPSSEPSSEAEPKSEPEPAVEQEPSSETHPIAEPKSEPEPEPALEPELSGETHPIAEPVSEVELAVEPKSEPEPFSESPPEAPQDSKSEPAAESEPSSEQTGPKIESVNEFKKESESSNKLNNESIDEFQNKTFTWSIPATGNDSATLPTPSRQNESNNEFEKNKAIDKNLGIKDDNFLGKHESNDSFNNAATTSLPSSETTTISSEPSAVIGLKDDQSTTKQATTDMNDDNQSSMGKFSNTNNENETDILLGKELVKKGPRLDKDEQGTPNPLEPRIKDVVSDNERKNDTNVDDVDVNDSFIRNINSSSNIKSLEKNEVSPEEQYNDITDDFVPKGFGKNDIELSHDERKIQKIYKENKNINHTKSKVDVELADKVVPKLTTPAVEMTDKRIEDPNMTSQVPILPIEIQLDMSTTENAEKVYPQTTSQEVEKEMISTTSSPKTTNAEGKTTEQIPILPEELQTTMTNKQEHHTESTLSVEMDKKSNGLLVADHKREKTEEGKSSKSNEDKSSLESTTLKENLDEDSIEKTTVYNTPSEGNESSVQDTIKPVFESISDDTTPQTFEYKYLLTTTTEKPELSNGSEEMTEEQLRVIPLEEKNTYMDKSSQITDDQTKLKKEKELSFKTSADRQNGNNVDKKSSRTVDDDNIPKLIPGSSSGVNPDEELKTIFISPDFNSGKPKAVIPLSEKKVNLTDNVKYPNFIPVSEEIDENDYHFTEPTHSPFNNHHDIATDLPELDSNVERNSTNEEVERDVKEFTTELLEAVESSTNKTLLVENLLTKTEASNDKNKNEEQAVTEENKVIANSTGNSTSEPDQSEFLGIPVSIVTSEQGIPQQIFFSKCKSGQFQCINGTSRDGSYCVELSSTCDSENDCSDGSDELDCEKEGCPGNFQCASGQCLTRHLVCNGIVDCDDGSDEKECPNWKCHFDEFQCPNGRCIPVLWQCDGRPDCENHVDEYSCSESCGNDEYLCPTEKWCIPQTWRCNGVPECVNGEDEKLCECAVDQFKCETGGCIPTEQLCDGVENCPDRSDEWNCLSGFGKNSTIASEADKENKETEFSTKSSPVKIRQSNGEQKYICSDGWTNAFSDQYCRSLGFSASESTQFMEVGADKKLLQLVSNANPNSSIVLNLEKAESCKSEKIVEVSCQEFSCGSHESVGPTARLVGGTPATEGQWSSVALLKEPKYGTACTASVLSPMHALASYSCIYSNRQSSGWQLFVNGNLQKPNKVKNIVPYPQVKYNQFLYNNDIALVELAEPLVFSRNVSAACLPNQLFQPPQLCVTVGWGFPVNGEIDLQQYLKFLPVPTYNSEECNATSHYAGFITKSNICAGFTDTDKGPCYNDEGAPLMCVSETGRWEIQGLLSHHSRCSRGHPAIYSSLAPALSWLRNSVPALQTHSSNNNL